MSDQPQPLQNISDVVAPADLNTWAGIAGVLRYLAEPVQEPDGALAGSPISITTITNSFRNLYAAARQAGVDPHHARVGASLWSIIKGDAAGLVTLLGELFGYAAQLVFAILANIWGGMRKGEDWGASQIAAMAMEEVFLTPVDVSLMPTGTTSQDHLTRVTQLGAIVHGVLRGEFQPAQNGVAIPAVEPAERLAGIMVNSGISSALMGMLGEMIPWLHEDEMHDLLNAVVQNLGLGRLARRALTPIIQILVAKPLEWALNTQYTPTQFSLGELVNPYAQTLLPQDKLFTAMNLLGFSNDKIQAFIEMHQKRLTVTDAYKLGLWGTWGPDQVLAYVKALGYPTELSEDLLVLEELRQMDPWITKLIDELETELKNGNLTLDEFQTVVNAQPYSSAVKNTILLTAEYKVKAHAGKTRVAHLGYGQLKQAFEEGIITQAELYQRWTAQGYTQDDQDVLYILILLDLQKKEAAAAAKAAKAAKGTAAPAAGGLVTPAPATTQTPSGGGSGSTPPTTP